MTFEFWLTIGVILFGIILVIGGFFAVTVLISQNLGGIWASMDCHQKLTFHATMFWALGIGIFLIIAGCSLLLYPIRNIPKTLAGKPFFPRPLSLKFWILFQILAALFVIAFTLISFFDVTVFGGPYGCGHYHLIPLYFPVTVILVELSATILAFLTYWQPHTEYIFGWIIIGVLRLCLAIVFLFIPWFYLIDPFTVMNDLTFNIVELFFGCITLIGALALRPIFRLQSALRQQQSYVERGCSG